MNSPSRPFETIQFCKGANYANSEMLRIANTNCLSPEAENRATGARVLLYQWNCNQENWLDYHKAKLLSLICIHAHGTAKAEFAALGVDDSQADSAGFKCIGICQEAQIREEMSEQTFQPFFDLCNIAFNTMNKGTEGMRVGLVKYQEKRDKVLAEEELERQEMDVDAEESEYESEPEVEDEVESAEDEDKLKLGIVKTITVAAGADMLEIALKNGDLGNKKVLMLMQSNEDTITCWELLNDHFAERKEAAKAARRAAWEEARKEAKYAAIQAAREAGLESESEGNNSEEYTAADYDGMDEVSDWDDDEESEEDGDDDVSEPSAKRGREDEEFEAEHQMSRRFKAAKL